MKSTVTRIFNGYETDIIPQEGQITIIMKSIESGETLSTIITNQAMPGTLHNVINTPQQLFITLQNIPKEQVKVVNQDTLILKTEVFFVQRQYLLPLDKKEEHTQVYRTHYQTKSGVKSDGSSYPTLKKKVSFSSTVKNQEISQSRRQKMLSELNYNLSQENWDLQEENMFNIQRIEEIETKNNELTHQNIKLGEERDRLKEENKNLQLQKGRLSQILVEGEDEAKVKTQIGSRSEIKQEWKMQIKTQSQFFKPELSNLDNEAVNNMQKIVIKQTQIANLTQERVKLSHEKLNLMKEIDQLKKDILKMTNQASKLYNKFQNVDNTNDGIQELLKKTYFHQYSFLKYRKQ